MSTDNTLETELDTKTSTEPSGLFLRKIGLIVVAILLILAAWAGQTILVIILGLVLSAAGLSKLWSRLSLKGVNCERHLTEQRVFPDEQVELKLRVINRKILPLPWIQVSDEVPAGFLLNQPAGPGNRNGFETISQSTSILWYSAISWKYHLVCKKRGYYRLGPLTVTSGDIFGFYPRTMKAQVTDYLIVYPKIYTINHLVIPSLYPLGEAKSDKRIFEDPSRTIGVRDYSPGDSLRRIHWKASARRQQLQVKVFEPSTTLRAGIFLVIDSFKQDGIWDVDNLELGISTAASIANHLAGKNSQTGLWANSKLADSDQNASVPLGGGVNQLVRILEVLAKIIPDYNSVFMDYFQNERKNLPLGITLIFITANMPDQLKALLGDLKEKGYKLLVFQIGKEDKARELPEIECHNIQKPGDLEWIQSSENR